MVEPGAFSPIHPPAIGPVSAQLRGGERMGYFLRTTDGTVGVGPGVLSKSSDLHSQYCYPSPYCRPDRFADRSAILSGGQDGDNNRCDPATGSAIHGGYCNRFRRCLARGRALVVFSFVCCRSLAHSDVVHVIKQRGTTLCAVLFYSSLSSRFSVFRVAFRTISSAALPVPPSVPLLPTPLGSIPSLVLPLAARLVRLVTNILPPAVKRFAFGRKLHLKRRMCHQAPAAFLHLKDAC